MNKKYDYRNCQSLFGYAQSVHRKSGAICQLCDCGMNQQIDFDLWRQMTVEHLIGESQGGYLHQIRDAIAQKFSDLTSMEQERLSLRIDDANTVTACSFCNATTSRDVHPKTISELLEELNGSPDEIVNSIIKELQEILSRKRICVQWKLEYIRDAFNRMVLPELNKTRSNQGAP